MSLAHFKQLSDDALREMIEKSRRDVDRLVADDEACKELDAVILDDSDDYTIGAWIKVAALHALMLAELRKRNQT